MSTNRKAPEKKSALEEKLAAQLADETEAPNGQAPEDISGEVPLEEPLPLEPADGPDLDELGKALQEREAEVEALKDQLLRMRAEFDNFRKRTAREIEHIRKTAAQDLILDLLPVVDNFERALEHAGATDNGFVEGVAMVLEQCRDVLKARGLETIPGEGEPFDPNVHEAIAQLPSDGHPSGIVIEEYQRGYRMGGTIVRPAKVVVSNGPPEAAQKDAAPVEEASEH